MCNCEVFWIVWKVYGLENVRGKYEFYWFDLDVKLLLVDGSDILFDVSCVVYILYYFIFCRILDLFWDLIDDRGFFL